VDETGQPGSEPARANGNGTGDGAGSGHPTAWQLAAETSSRLEPNAPRPESPGSRLDAARSNGSVRTAEPFSAPWGGVPLITGPRGRTEPYSRYDMLAPVSPAVPAPSPPRPRQPDQYDFDAYETDAYETDSYEGNPEPVSGDGEREEWRAPWIPADQAPRPDGPENYGQRSRHSSYEPYGGGYPEPPRYESGYESQDDEPAGHGAHAAPAASYADAPAYRDPATDSYGQPGQFAVPPVRQQPPSVSSALRPSADGLRPAAPPPVAPPPVAPLPVAPPPVAPPPVAPAPVASATVAPVSAVGPRAGQPVSPAAPHPSTSQPMPGFTSPPVPAPPTPYQAPATRYEAPPGYGQPPEPTGRGPAQPVSPGFGPPPSSARPVSPAYGSPSGVQPVSPAYGSPSAVQPVSPAYGSPSAVQPVSPAYGSPSAAQPVSPGFGPPPSSHSAPPGFGSSPSGGLSPSGTSGFAPPAPPRPAEPGLAPPPAPPQPDPEPGERGTLPRSGPFGPTGAFLLAGPAPTAAEVLGTGNPSFPRTGPPDTRSSYREPGEPTSGAGAGAAGVGPDTGPGDMARAAARASASAQAAQAALSAVRAAHARAAQDDVAAVEAAYAAAVDAGGDLSEYSPQDDTEFQQPRLVPGGALPQRVPAAPDVPDVPDDEPEYDYVEQEPTPTPLASPELARIATHLRSDEDIEQEAPGRPDGFDMQAVLGAVREVEGVRDAQLRPNPNGVHTLRLDLADGADGARVSREVARLLKQRMGLAAEPRRPAAAGPGSGSGSGPGPGPGHPGGPAPAHEQSPDPGQPHDAMPVAGAAPAPRIPIPASAAENLGGPAAANATGPGRGADERNREPQRRHAVTGLRGRAAADNRGGYLSGEHAQAAPPLRKTARSGEGSRVVLDQVQVNTLGLDATVTVRLLSGGGPAEGKASGPAVDGYVLRLAAVAAAAAIDQLLSTVDNWEQQRGRCFVEHAAVVPLGSCEVAVVVVLLVCGGWVEQLSGAALVNGDPRQAVVRATLAAVNRRLDGLLG
jgi:hypothetical protein